MTISSLVLIGLLSVGGLNDTSEVVSCELPHRILNVRVWENGTDKVVLSESSIGIGADGRIAMESGGEVSLGDDTDARFQVGTRITGRLTSVSEKKDRMELVVRTGTTIQNQEGSTQRYRTESIKVRASIKPGEPLRVRCGANRWCEVCVETP